ncbi:hypothetical protein VQ056_12490 [Paenibacillus sp. JTLBN-2024]
MKYYSISEAAAKFDILNPRSYHCEKKGLLPLIGRDAAGRRLFSEDSMTLLKVVIYLKNTHMPIKKQPICGLGRRGDHHHPTPA